MNDVTIIEEIMHRRRRSYVREVHYDERREHVKTPRAMPPMLAVRMLSYTVAPRPTRCSSRSRRYPRVAHMLLCTRKIRQPERVS
jgi:hypothetical protein